MKTQNILFFSLILMAFTFFRAGAINTKDTRMLSQPTISDSHIAFVYADDLWVANSDGSQAQRITADEGIESSPVFSPDGKLIAFSAQYDGNMDVFTVPVEGGIPKRLTWHPGRDYVRSFTPDGSAVLFASQRNVHTNRYLQLFTVPIAGGFPTQLEIPNADRASYSPNGKSMAYTPIPGRFQQWKNYRGGTVATIWLISFKDYSVVKIPQPKGRCNDTDPMWIGEKIYFRSDRNGEFNLFSFNPKSETIEQLTTFDDFPILSASKGDGEIVFEQAGYLHTYNITNGDANKLTIGIAADLLELRQRFVKGAKYIRSANISPTGARAVFDFRGEIITVPAKKGDARNLTQTAGVHEKYPSWSPDGNLIAYFSDASGEYELNILPQDGKGEAKTFQLNGTGFYAYPEWSPDSKKICFVDNGRNLYLIDINTGIITKIDEDELYVPGAFRQIFNDWSFDSKWVAYTKITDTNFKQIFLYSTEEAKSYPITDGLSEASEPVFDKSGKYLYFFASTDAGPVVNWFDQSNADMEMTNSIYLATLQNELISPFAKESDEETIGEDDDESKDDDEDNDKKDSEEKNLTIDFAGIENRIVNVPVKAGNYAQLSTPKEGQIFYIVSGASYSDPRKMHKYDLKDRKDSEIMDADSYVISANGKKMLYRKGSTWGIVDTGEKPKPENGKLKVANLQVKIDPLKEWPQTLDEAWRVNRDYFYDPGMHGADWLAMKKKYEQFLPDLATRADLNRLIQWMCSEIGVGHHRYSGGEKLNNPQRIKGGLLGADYSINNGRYQFKKIIGGLNWNPNLRSPLTEPGVNAKVGDYLLAVNGKDLTSSVNLYSFFENSDGKIVELTIGANPNYQDSKVVKVVPVGNESALRNRDWVEGNLKKVTEATNGKVAYVYVPNTAGLGHEYFKRYFFPQANRQAIIIDERFNGGGSLADYYIDILQRPYQAHWNMRYGKDLKSPSASIQGPKVMIIDETAGSGGDMLPWMFRKFKVGTLVGKRTWGGLVGVLGFPEFIDGGSVTAPNVAIWTEDGFVVENVGVPPDIEVEQWPAEVIKGKDPQLEKAIEVALKKLKENPPVEPIRPPFPVRVRQ
jgi:tricorn protease